MIWKLEHNYMIPNKTLSLQLEGFIEIDPWHEPCQTRGTAVFPKSYSMHDVMDRRRCVFG